MNELYKNNYICRILNLHDAFYVPGTKTLILSGPVKMERFIELKNYIKHCKIEISDVIVKEG